MSEALPAAKTKRAAVPLMIELVRELTLEDVAAEANAGPVGASSGGGPLRIRESHHRLAQALAEGHSQELASRMTGYSPSYISTLKGDPAFAELLDYYRANRALIFVDVQEKLKALGSSAVDELSVRLEEKPELFTNQQLKEIAEMALKTPGGVSGGPGVSVSINFVSPEEVKSATVTIEGDASDVG